MKRDLSAFQAERAVNVPPPPPPPPPPAAEAKRAGPPKPADKRQEERAKRASRVVTPAEPARKRAKVMVSVPVLLHAALRAAAEERDCFKGDVVLDAYDRFADQLREEHAKGAGHRTRSGRRRRVADPTPCQLYLSQDERRSLDNLAAEVGESRSALVTRLLRLELDEGA